MPSRTASSRPVRTAAALDALVLSACAGPSARLGVGVPVGPFSVGVGVGSGGVSAGVYAASDTFAAICSAVTEEHHTTNGPDASAFNPVATPS